MDFFTSGHVPTCFDYTGIASLYIAGLTLGVKTCETHREWNPLNSVGKAIFYHQQIGKKLFYQNIYH